ncbi:hypothetical protein V8C37DRAFT_386379 [Trichoderma ceciliae]
MWDRARTSATAGLDRLHRTTRRHLKEPEHLKEGAFCQNDVDGPVNALGIDIDVNGDIDIDIQTGIALQTGIVRAASPTARSATRRIGMYIFPTDDPAADAKPSSHIALEPPPRNPRRLLRQYSKDSGWPFAAATYPELQLATDSESNSTSGGDGYSSSPASNSMLASTYSRRGPPALDQISPPSSPETGAFKYDAPVSPLDDDDADFHREYPVTGSQQPQPFATQPQMTNVPLHQYRPYQPAAETHDASFENPRSLEDVPIPHGALPRSNKMRLNLTSDGSVAQRFRFLAKGKSEPTETLSDRPTQGGPAAAPIHIPRRSSRRISRVHNGSRNISAPLPPIQSSSELETPPRQQAIADRDLVPSTLPPRPPITTTPASKLTPRNANTTNALPTPPNHNHEYPTPPSMQSAQAQSPAGPESTPTGPRIIKRKPPQTRQVEPSALPSLPGSSPAYINPPPRRASAAAVTGLRDAAPKRTNTTDESWTQPPSRFSVTTYATSNAGTPGQFPGEQVNAITQPTVPIVSRPGPFARRDIPSVPSASHAITIPKQRAYKSSPHGVDNKLAASGEVSLSGPAHDRAGSNTESTRRSSILSTTKPLPPAPPELASSDDRIAQLNAVLSGLAHRRVNINRSIQQMTELMPRDNLMASEEVLRKREIEKQKVEGLKQELAEIQHEEYDLGLKLHRAYKRLDKNAEYEPTTLWVRRITTG